MVAGVSGYEILIAQVFTQFIVLVGQVAATLVFTLVVFSVPCNGPVGWVILLTLLQGTAGMCFGKIQIVSVVLLCTFSGIGCLVEPIEVMLVLKQQTGTDIALSNW